MTPRIYRPATPRSGPYSPSWRQWRGLLVVEGRRLLLTIAGLFIRAGAGRLLLLAGFLVQSVLVWLLWQLVDLSISLMEVWAELARKHLELVLS